MKKYKKSAYTLVLSIVFVCILPLSSSALPPDPDCDPLDPACPIDGGIGLLIAAGIGLGARQIIKKNN